MNILQRLFWYVKRPRLYYHFVCKLFSQVLLRRPSLENSRQAAVLWCRGLAVSCQEAIRQITSKDVLERLKDQYKDIFERACEAEKVCPVRMGGAGDLDLIYRLAEYVQARNVVETGVAYGWSSLAILLSLQNRSGSGLFSTDMPYPEMNNEQYVGCVVPDGLRRNWTLFRCADRSALPKALKRMKTIDMCHYDSDKSYAGRTWAYNLLWKHLRPGGVFVSDDIGDNTAFRDFAESVGQEPVVVESDNKYVGVIVKYA